MSLKCGIEIHQRLATGKKLFCSCSSRLSQEPKIGGEVRRILRPVYGELGEVDPAAEFEGSRGRKFVYQIVEENSCLVELDEQPPEEINGEALETVVEIALLLGARVLDEVLVMRKTVIDGSSPSAFQRTALVAVDGKITTSFGEVKIPTICVEEDSAGIIDQSTGKYFGEVAYRLDRLGIPLVEIATDASIKSGRQAREVAEKIGLLLRSTGKVQRGIGSIRQDLNVSIEGGVRVEIKGAQELTQVEALVENEAKRQRKLLEIREALGKRPVENDENIEGAKNEKHGRPTTTKDVSRIFEKTDAGLVKKALAEGKIVLACRLRGFKHLLGTELLANHRLGTELSDYAKAAAGVTGIIHSDEEHEKYGFSKTEITALEKELQCGEGDSWAICVADEKTAEKALQAVLNRAAAAREIGVLKETRRADGENTRFMRPLPGSARMYPETDVPPVKIPAELVQKIGGRLPETFEEKKTRFQAAGLNSHMAEVIARSGQAKEFEEMLVKTRAEPTLVAATMTQALTALAREGVAVEKISSDELANTLAAVAESKIVKAAVPELLKKIAEGNSFEKALQKTGLYRVAGATLEELVKKEVAKGRKVQQVLAENRLRVDALELQAIAKKLGLD